MVEKEALIALVRAVQAGEDDAATQLYITFQKDIYYFIYKTVNDRELAEDLTQDTFLDILQHIHKLEEPVAFVAWSRQIAYHNCTAYFRKRHDLLVDEEEDGYSVFDTMEEERAEFIPDAALDQEDFKKTIQEMINSLPAEQRSALMMRYFQELSVEEIAKIQGVPVGTVKSRLNYSRKAIKQSVESYEKKTGVKLRCVGVLPILLWLFRGVRVSKGISLTAKAATTTFTAVNTAAAAASTVSVVGDTADAVSGVASVAKKGVKKGLGALFKTTTSKVIAGVTATAVLGGGAAVIATQPEKTAPVVYEQQEESEVTEPEWTMEWVGYGECDSTAHYRYEISIDTMDGETVSGTMALSYTYEGVLKTEFTGQAREQEAESVTTYDITLKKGYDLTFGSMVTTAVMEYREDDQTITLTEYPFIVTLQQQKAIPDSKVLLENKTYIGDGQDYYHGFEIEPNAKYEVSIEKMTTETVNGTLQVYCIANGSELMHETTFTGRGYEGAAGYYYELKLDTVRDGDTAFGYERTQYLWLYYDEIGDCLHWASAAMSNNFCNLYSGKMDPV